MRMRGSRVEDGCTVMIDIGETWVSFLKLPAIRSEEVAEVEVEEERSEGLLIAAGAMKASAAATIISGRRTLLGNAAGK